MASGTPALTPSHGSLGLDAALDASDEAAAAVTTVATHDERLLYARAFGVRSVQAWWTGLEARSTHGQALRPFLQAFALLTLPKALMTIADRFGTAVAGMEPELAAFAIGRAYTEMLPTDYRSRLGIYYTPPLLTARLIALASEAGTCWRTARVLDPACGGGAFLAPVAREMINALPGCSPRILVKNIATRLRGYEIDSFAAWLSQVTLDAVLLPLTRAIGRPIPALVTVRDSLARVRSGEQFDLVIGNPPYGRVRLEAEQRTRFKRSLYGHANLYGMFTDVALQLTKPEGVVAYVTPTSFLAGQYFKNLRTLLAREAAPATIDFVDARKGVFDGVLQETLLAAYVRGAGAMSVRVREISPKRGGIAVLEVGVASLPADPAQPWLLPRRPADAALVAQLSSMPHRLSDWGYEVSTGPLVWNRHKDQLVSERGAGRAPLIWAESVTSDGQFEYRAVKRNHTPYFDVRAEDDWLLVDRPCVLVQRTTAKEQSRRLIAAHLPAAFLAQHGGVAVVENHLNMVRPPAGTMPRVAPEAVAAFLNSPAADRAFRCVSGSVAVSAFELEALPLPAPSSLGPLAALVAAGASRDDIEAECRRLYGMGDGVPSALRQPDSHRRTLAAHISGGHA